MGCYLALRVTENIDFAGTEQKTARGQEPWEQEARLPPRFVDFAFATSQAKQELHLRHMRLCGAAGKAKAIRVAPNLPRETAEAVEKPSQP